MSLTPETQNPPSNLFDRAVILSVTLRRPGTRRKASTSLITVNSSTTEETSSGTDDSLSSTPTDKSLLHLSKDILDSKELREIQRLDGEVREYLSRIGLPSPLKQGCYLIPIELIEIIEAKLADFLANRELLIQSFLSTYPEKQAEAASRLGPLFNSRDYPSAEQITKAFEVATQYLTFGVPGSLQNISPSLLAREQEKAKQRIAAVEDEIIQVLRFSLKDLVDHMVERLQPGVDGKPKVFRNTLMSNMQEFLDTFKARNLTNDQDLDALVDQAKNILSGVDTQALRNSANIRLHVQTQMATIQQSLDTLVVSKPTRAYHFHDDETAPTPIAHAA